MKVQQNASFGFAAGCEAVALPRLIAARLFEGLCPG